MTFAVRIRGRLTLEERETFRREASDPTTPPERLADIARLRVLDRFAEIGPYLVANPNTPPETLLELAAEYPEAFALNPAAPLLPLERPDFMEAIPVGGQLRLLRRADLPLIFVRAWLRSPHSTVADAARWHVRVAGEADPIEETWQDEAWCALRFACRTPGGRNLLPQRDREELRTLDLLPRFIARRLGLIPDAPDLERSPTLDPTVRAFRLERLIQSRYRAVPGITLTKFCILATASLAADELSGAADALFWPTRLAASLNPHLALRCRVRLAEDGHRLVRVAARAFNSYSERQD